MRVRPGVSGYSAHCSIVLTLYLPYNFLLPVLLSLVVSCCLHAVARGLLALAQRRSYSIWGEVRGQVYDTSSCILMSGAYVVSHKKRSEKHRRMRVGTTYDPVSSSSLRSPIILGGHVPLCPGGSAAYAAN